MYEKILIVVGPRTASSPAVTEGVALAKAHDAEAVFLSMVPRYVMPVSEIPVMGLPSADEFHRDATRHARRLLAQATQVADQAGVRSSVAVGSGADDADAIAEAARQRRCGLIVVASAGHNAVMRLLGGSVIPGLITRSTVPVLVVKQPDAGVEPKGLAEAALDFGPACRAAASAHALARAPRIPMTAGACA